MSNEVNVVEEPVVEAKSIEVDFLVGDMAHFIDYKKRVFDYGKVEDIFTDGTSYRYGTNNASLNKFYKEDVGVSVFTEKPSNFTGTILVRKQLPSKINKPLFDTLTKEWILLNNVSEDYTFVEVITLEGKDRSYEMTGYGSCWGLSE